MRPIVFFSQGIILREFRLALLVFIAVSAAAGLSYFFAMQAGGNISISSDNQDWAGFGSYIGGILAPAAALLAGYMVYKSFASDAYLQKLILARESISRLEVVLEKNLEAPFKNPCYGDEYLDRPLRDIINALSNNKIPATEDAKMGILSLLHSTAILANSVRYYIGLLDRLPSAEKDSHWLGELEKGYWIGKYSPICTRMIRVVGQDAFEAKVSKEQLWSFNKVLGGE